MMMPMQTDIPRLPIRENGRAFSSEKAVRPRVRDRPLPYSTNMAAKSESRLAAHQALRTAAASVQPPANCRKPQEAGLLHDHRVCCRSLRFADYALPYSAERRQTESG